MPAFPYSIRTQISAFVGGFSVLGGSLTKISLETSRFLTLDDLGTRHGFNGFDPFEDRVPGVDGDDALHAPDAIDAVSDLPDPDARRDRGTGAQMLLVSLEARSP